MRLKSQSKVEPRTETPYPNETLIASGISIKGKIEGTDKVRISGQFEGSIQCKSTVSIEERGKVKGRIDAGSVVVAGEIDGDIDSTGRVDIQSQGRINGNIKAAHFTLSPKSVFDGQATIPRKAIEFLILSQNGRIRKLSDV